MSASAFSNFAFSPTRSHFNLSISHHGQPASFGGFVVAWLQYFTVGHSQVNVLGWGKFR